MTTYNGKRAPAGSASYLEVGQAMRAAIDRLATADAPPAAWLALHAVAYFTLSRSKWDDYVSRSEMAAAVGAPERTLSRGISALMKLGIITYEPGFRTPNGYTRRTHVEVRKPPVEATHVPDTNVPDMCVPDIHGPTYRPLDAYTSGTPVASFRDFDPSISIRDANTSGNGNSRDVNGGDEQDEAEELERKRLDDDPLCRRIVTHFGDTPRRRAEARHFVTWARTALADHLIDEVIGRSVGADARHINFFNQTLRTTAAAHGVAMPGEPTTDGRT